MGNCSIAVLNHQGGTQLNLDSNVGPGAFSNDRSSSPKRQGFRCRGSSGCCQVLANSGLVFVGVSTGLQRLLFFVPRKSEFQAENVDFQYVLMFSMFNCSLAKQ